MAPPVGAAKSKGTGGWTGVFLGTSAKSRAASCYICIHFNVSVNALTCRPSRLWCWSPSCNSFQVVLVVLIFIVDTCEKWSETNT